MKKRVLIAEDDFLQSTALEMLVENAGLQVVSVCRTGIDILNEVPLKKPDLILSDLFLEDDSNGLDVILEIRKKYDTPVIFITGQSSRTFNEEMNTVSDSLILHKPISGRELYDAIKRLMNVYIQSH